MYLQQCVLAGSFQLLSCFCVSFLQELAGHQFFAENHLVHSYLVDEEVMDYRCL